MRRKVKLSDFYFVPFIIIAIWMRVSDNYRLIGHITIFLLYLYGVYMQLAILKRSRKKRDKILIISSIIIGFLYELLSFIFYTVDFFYNEYSILFLLVLALVFDFPQMIDEIKEDNRKRKEYRQKNHFLYGKEFKKIKKEFYNCNGRYFNMPLKELNLDNLDHDQERTLEWKLSDRYFLSIRRPINYFKNRKELKKYDAEIERILFYLKQDDFRFSEEFYLRVGIDPLDEEATKRINLIFDTIPYRKMKKYTSKSSVNMYFNTNKFKRRVKKLYKKYNKTFTDEMFKELGIDPEDTAKVEYVKSLIYYQ